MEEIQKNTENLQENRGIYRERRIAMAYGVSVLIFCLGVCISAGLVGYVIHGNKKYKISSPGREEEEK